MITMEDIKRCMDAQPDKLSAANVEGVFMKAAFDHVCDKDDWKAPIDTMHNQRTCEFSLDVIEAAVEYMTATKAKFISHGYPWVQVKAAGYRAGPAGP